MKNASVLTSRPILMLLLAVLVLAPAAGAQTALDFSKSFAPATIGPGSVSTLTLEIANNTSGGVRNLDFTDVLPAGVTIASPANAATAGCSGGTLTAPDGGGTLAYTGGGVGALATCTITVDVTSSTVGTHTNTTGALTSDLGSHGSASADLTVATDRPGFSKSFDPSAVFFGGRSTLTFTIDNTLNGSDLLSLDFADNLPAGMVVADPANASTTCGTPEIPATITAVAGSSVIVLDANGVFAFPALAAGATCTVTVDVVGNAIGELGNTTDELTSSVGATSRSSGKASAVLSVSIEQIALTKSFVDDPVAPGGTVTLEFTVRNLDRRNPASNIAFSDDLEAVISGLATSGATTPDPPCGAGSSLTDSAGFLTFAGGSLAAEGSCTFSVTLAVPSTAAAGSYTNTTSVITADVGGDPVVGDPASDDLFVEPGPTLTKTFSGDPVTPGDPIELTFTITNTASTTATDISFSDVFVEELPTAVTASIPAAGSCGAGSTFVYTPLVNPPSPSSAIPATLVVSGATLDAGEPCDFSITLNVSSEASSGTYLNTTSEITATVDGATVTGNPATDSFDVVAAPDIQKVFLDDPVAPGGTVTLEITLNHDEDAPGDATAIGFSDDLTLVLSGLTAVGLPATGVCGPGSEISGTTNLSFTGGTLAPGETCSIPVTLQVPAAAEAGTYSNTTSNIVASVSGVAVTGQTATDDFAVAGLTLAKSFTDDPVLPGGTVTLEFTIANSANAPAASDIYFLDDLDEVIANMTAILPSVPDPPCGAGSALGGLSGNTLLELTGGSLAAGESCTFSVTLQVPAAAASDTYLNLTSSFSATIDGATLNLENAADQLTVLGNVLSFTKEFVDDPVEPGDNVTLQFTLENLSTEAITTIAWSDDLDAALSGLVATGLPLSACGGTVATVDGGMTIDFSGGTLAANEICSFDVTLTVPLTAELGTVAVNTTSEVTGTSGGLGVTGDPASDVLEIAFIRFGKAFSEEIVQPGDTVTLTFTVANLSETESLADLEFSDDLEAVIPGLAVTGGPVPDPPCGGTSLFTGTAFITVTGIDLLPGGSCSFSVELTVPAGAEPGEYVNETSDLRQQGIGPVAPAATAGLTVVGDQDEDDDGVPNGADFCSGTTIPERVPTVRLGRNRFALTDDEDPLVFDTNPPPGEGPQAYFTTEDTGGCSCDQIITELGLGRGHEKFGCSLSAMRDWVSFVTESQRTIDLYTRILGSPKGDVTIP